MHISTTEFLISSREDDTKWPQKNKDGRQELEIRLGNEHISFEVIITEALACTTRLTTMPDCQNRLASGRQRIRRSRRSSGVLLSGARPESSCVLAHLASLQGICMSARPLSRLLTAIPDQTNLNQSARRQGAGQSLRACPIQTTCYRAAWRLNSALHLHPSISQTRTKLREVISRDCNNLQRHFGGGGLRSESTTRRELQLGTPITVTITP